MPRAHVVIEDRDAQPLGGSLQAFSGTVKNQGGTEARDVVVAITVTEPDQGAECLRDEIDVAPAALPPGALGTFYAEFDNPCFFGTTKTVLRADWR